MSDPYELTRARVEMLKEADDGGANLSPRDYELMLLLADADALLEFMNTMRDAVVGGGQCTEEDDCPYCLFEESFAVIPEHLK